MAYASDDGRARAGQPVETSGTTAIAAEVQAQAGRLKSRLAAAPAPQEPLRNPFAFEARAVPERRDPPLARKRSPPPIQRPPLEPAIELIGVAESESRRAVRTAIISALDGELFLVKEGETSPPAIASVRSLPMRSSSTTC